MSGQAQIRRPDGEREMYGRSRAAGRSRMNIDEEQFRADARAFLEATVPRKGTPVLVDSDGVTRAKAYQRDLADAGFAGITWPEEYGGRGLPGRFQRGVDRGATALLMPPKALDDGRGPGG